MAHLYDSDYEYEIEEVDISPVTQPYQYEPTRRQQAMSDTDSSESSETEESQSQDDLPDLESWCACSRCVMMPTYRECKCCQSIPAVQEKANDRGVKCITEDAGFIATCINRDSLETSYWQYREENGPPLENQQIHEVYRYIAYRRFTRWIYHILGKWNRRVIPACVVNAIRTSFPSQQYCGFTYAV